MLSPNYADGIEVRQFTINQTGDFVIFSFFQMQPKSPTEKEPKPLLAGRIMVSKASALGFANTILQTVK